MAHLLHIDSSIQGDRSVSRKLTAHTNPAMAELIPLADQSLAEAEHAIDALWAPVPALA
jgi:FMN-dependent NADH-azoreductase